MQPPHVVQDCFHHILRLKTLNKDDDAASQAHDIHTVLVQTLETLLRQPDTFGLTLADAQDIAFAVVALADESALSHSPSVAAQWQHDLLQTRLFGENRAGEQFFVRLDALLTQGHARHSAILAYHTALGLGFVGRWAHQPQAAAQLLRIRKQSRDALLEAGAVIERTLAPEALVPLVVNREESVRMLRRFHAVLGVMAVALVGTVMLGSLSLQARAEALVERTELALARLGLHAEVE